VLRLLKELLLDTMSFIIIVIKFLASASLWVVMSGVCVYYKYWDYLYMCLGLALLGFINSARAEGAGNMLSGIYLMYRSLLKTIAGRW